MNLKNLKIGQTKVLSSKWNKAPIIEVVKLKEWQDLRESLVGTWKQDAVKNVKKLKDFLDDFSDLRKLRIVLNYLSGSGFRIGKISHPDITKLKNKVKKELEKQRGQL